jgi:hypothetical protein
MVDTYIGVFEDHTVARLAREDIDAVRIAYCIDPTLPPGEETAATAMVRGDRVIAAMHKIYRALRRGALEARARRNGAGDVETITPNQWLSLKFQSWNGHDLAVPINVEQDLLDLPRAFEDYVGGRVPADFLPAVWPDPHLIANQVLQIWPCHEPTRLAPAVDVPPRSADEPVLSQPPERPSGLSNRDWETYIAALEKRFHLGIHGNVTRVARSIARDRGHHSEYESERRSIHRVLKALRKKIERYSIE